MQEHLLLRVYFFLSGLNRYAASCLSRAVPSFMSSLRNILQTLSFVRRSCALPWAGESRCPLPPPRQSLSWPPSRPLPHHLSVSLALQFCPCPPIFHSALPLPIDLIPPLPPPFFFALPRF